MPSADVHVHVYDTRTKRWNQAAPLPAPRGGLAAVVLEGMIHVLGGGNSKSTIADHDVAVVERFRVSCDPTTSFNGPA